MKYSVGTGGVTHPKQPCSLPAWGRERGERRERESALPLSEVSLRKCKERGKKNERQIWFKGVSEKGRERGERGERERERKLPECLLGLLRGILASSRRRRHSVLVWI